MNLLSIFPVCGSPLFFFFRLGGKGKRNPFLRREGPRWVSVRKKVEEKDSRYTVLRSPALYSGATTAERSGKSGPNWRNVTRQASSCFLDPCRRPFGRNSVPWTMVRTKMEGGPTVARTEEGFTTPSTPRKVATGRQGGERGGGQSREERKRGENLP